MWFPHIAIDLVFVLDILTYLHTYIHIHLLTYSMEQSPSEADRFSASQIPSILWNPRFITAFTSARHLSLSWANSIQSTPLHPTSWRSLLILSSHLPLGLSSCIFPSGFSTKTLYTPLFSPIRATCPAHLLDLIALIIFGEQYRSSSSSLCSFLYSPVTSSLSDPNIPLNTLFSNTVSLRSSFNASDQVSHPVYYYNQYIYIYISLF